ncbi:MAG: tryptophan synthase subunit alpha [Proteobacteria bacterium]|nr:tryptophan synthase subunit alpha [Pseudomonadota bacterium]MBU1686111.1 tryptophan synthase subunit alpha [Pseudomonadota bacterium]
MQLTEYIREARTQKEILLMTHLVLGYPDFTVNREVIWQMVKNGVDLIEMQIPFSEPVADGPMILKANQESIDQGTTVRQCFDFAAEITSQHQIPFLFMTYYNILFKYGVEKFLNKAAKIGIQGLIVPDLPPEEGEEYLTLCKKIGLAPIMIYAPTSTEERMRQLADHADGFIYCVARRGVTGKKTDFSQDFSEYMARCSRATDLPLAVGFGISNREDVRFLVGKGDIAVIGTRTIQLVNERGAAAVGPFIAGLR